jgi:hypothetical protein
MPLGGMSLLSMIYVFLASTPKMGVLMLSNVNKTTQN